MLRVTVQGAAGRMGRMFVTQIVNDPETTLAGATEISGNPLIGQDAATVAGLPPCGVNITDDMEACLAKSDAVIVFTSPAATMELVPKAAKAGVAMVIGTTGLTDENKAQLAQAADNGAKIVFAPNMSVGVNLLFALCAKVARILDDSYDIEVVEMHHNQKKDAPSGTAERLGEILCEARGLSYAKDVRHGRFGMPGPRTKSEIGMHSLRGGDVVGDHTVIFAANGERIELTHKASSRETFAKGAMRAVKFLADAKSGMYDMQDVLGLK